LDSVTQTLSDYAATLAYGELDEDAIHGMKRCLVDSFACAVGATDAEPTLIARKLAGRYSSTTPSQVLFTGETTTPELAAFANSLMVRYLDCNDTYRVKEGGHPSDAIPAVLAVADARHVNGRTTLLGLIATYEVFAAMAAAEALGPVGLDHTVHTTIAAAVGAGRVMGLDAEAMANAISLALVPNVGLRVAREGKLSMWKGAAAPNAARNGVFAAHLAELGMTGPDEPWLAASGLARLLEDAPVLPAMAGRGERFHTSLTNMKFFPAEYHTQAPIWAAMELRKQADPAKLASVDIHTYEFAYHEVGEGEAKWRVSDRETADHSLPYLISAALLDGDIGLHQFTEGRIVESTVQALMTKVRVFEDRELTKNYPGVIEARIEATGSDGTAYTVRCQYPKGHVKNPLTDKELDVKFARLAGGLMAEDHQRRALDGLWGIESATNVSQVLAAFQFS
jgi:2-methylcitrate dehydratase